MNSNESIFTAMLRLAQYEYYPIRVSKTSPIPQAQTFAWVMEWDSPEIRPNNDNDDALPTIRNFNDPDLFLTEREVQELIMAPEQYMTPEQKKVFKDRFRDWELVVTEYKPQLPTIYDHTKGEEQRKKLRKAAILARMSPEDRKLFE